MTAYTATTSVPLSVDGVDLRRPLEAAERRCVFELHGLR